MVSRSGDTLIHAMQSDDGLSPFALLLSISGSVWDTLYTALTFG